MSTKEQKRAQLAELMRLEDNLKKYWKEHCLTGGSVEAPIIKMALEQIKVAIHKIEEN